jgi:hypothetical protein
MRGNAGHSSFEAFQLRVDSRRISRLGIQLGTNYMLSHSIDDSSISGTSLAIANVGTGFLDALTQVLIEDLLILIRDIASPLTGFGKFRRAGILIPGRDAMF